MKKILLTGGAGFIGSHTIEHFLRNTDMEIYVIDRLSYAGNLNRLVEMDIWEKEKTRVHFIYHDFRSAFPFFIKKQLSEIEYIIHMGGETHVANSFKYPKIFLESNVIGTMNVLDLAREINPSLFVYVSTDEVYGAVVGDKLHVEGEPHRPSNPYSASKSGGEAIVHSYWKSFGVPMIITNTMNNFGQRQDPEKFVPKTMLNILQNKTVDIHCATDSKNGKVIDISSRCWLHARNHADALLFLLEHSTIGERYNIVGERRNVYELAQMIATALGKNNFNYDYVPFHSYSPGHDMHYGLDGTKMKELGWIPPVPFENSLEKTVQWTKDNPKWLGLD